MFRILIKQKSNRSRKKAILTERSYTLPNVSCVKTGKWKDREPNSHPAEKRSHYLGRHATKRCVTTQSTTVKETPSSYLGLLRILLQSLSPLASYADALSARHASIKSVYAGGYLMRAMHT